MTLAAQEWCSTSNRYQPALARLKNLDGGERTAMKRLVIWWAALGFAAPLLWGVVSFIFFSARESVWTNIYWGAVYVTCPFWLLPTSTFTTIIMPLLNAILYGGLAFLVLNARGKWARRRDSSA